MRGQSSFQVHLGVTVVVIIAAALLRCTLWEWCILALCIGGVLTAEMINSAMEYLAKAIDEKYNPHLGDCARYRQRGSAVCFAGCRRRRRHRAAQPFDNHLAKLIAAVRLLICLRKPKHCGFVNITQCHATFHGGRPA